MSGIYTGNGCWSFEVLELRPDGTFEERWTSYSGGTTVTHGEWTTGVWSGRVIVDVHGAYLANWMCEDVPHLTTQALIAETYGWATTLTVPEHDRPLVTRAAFDLSASGHDRPPAPTSAPPAQ